MSTELPLTLLVILAHPDDESFPIGGTIAKYATAGVRVILVCATRGEAGVPNLSSREAGVLRQQQLEAAAAVRGIAQVRWPMPMPTRLWRNWQRSRARRNPRRLSPSARMAFPAIPTM